MFTTLRQDFKAKTQPQKTTNFTTLVTFTKTKIAPFRSRLAFKSDLDPQARISPNMWYFVGKFNFEIRVKRGSHFNQLWNSCLSTTTFANDIFTSCKSWRVSVACNLLRANMWLDALIKAFLLVGKQTKCPNWAGFWRQLI